MTQRFFLLLALGIAVAGPVAAQYPNRALKVIPHAPAGSGPDMIARLLAASLQDALGQPVVVENRAGANGNIAGEFVARSPADGYTLLIATDAQFTINPHVYAKLPFDWNKDLLPVTSLATEAFKLVVSSSVPAKSVAEFIAYVRTLKKPLFYGSAGNGSQHHLTMELFKERTGIELTHIPYKGGGAATTQALLTGEIQATIGGAAADVQVKAGKLRALGVASAARSPRYPDLPTIGETIAGFEAAPWYGLFAPAGTPAEVVTRLRGETVKYLATPDAQAKINVSGPEVWISSPEAFAGVIRRDFDRNGKLVKALGIRLD
ncbi:MAG: tripartite tricarboxylate transporter substrate binding protein [Betaproteobacteria bacterium]|nr:tripartite tricarboxylate transporter substrate binding protein [Betaproteobacteria bacterium]